MNDHTIWCYHYLNCHKYYRLKDDLKRIGDESVTRYFDATYLKKSSLQNIDPFRAKHFSFSWTWHSLHCKHFACHVPSNTFSINRSKMSSWHPPHLGIVATKTKQNVNKQLLFRISDTCVVHIFTFRGHF